MKRYLLTTIVLFLFIGASYAEEELPTPTILPDHPLYPMKTFFERVRLWLTFTAESKARFHAYLAEQRLAELNSVLMRGKLEYAQRLREEYRRELEETEREMKRVSEAGRNVSELVENLSNVTQKFLSALENIQAKAPEQAKPIIEEMIEVVSSQRERYIQKLSEILPERAAELRTRLWEGKLEKVKWKLLEGEEKEVEELVETYEKELNETENLVRNAKALGRNVEALVDHICNVTYKHIQVLEEVLAKAPESAKEGIKRALEASIKAHMMCRERIERREEKEIKCSDDSECIGLICPMVVGNDTPVCINGKCVCGAKWQIRNRTEWERRYRREFSSVEEGVQETVRERVEAVIRERRKS